MSYLCPHCNSFPLGELHFVCIDGREALQLVIQTGVSASQAKVLKAHAGPQEGGNTNCCTVRRMEEGII